MDTVCFGEQFVTFQVTHDVHYGDDTWASWRLKSRITRGFVKNIVPISDKKHCCLCVRATGGFSKPRASYAMNGERAPRYDGIMAKHALAPVPLSIFRSNSKFDENSGCSSFEYTRPITTIFCTRHDSDTVVTCAKYRCDRPRIFYTRVFWIFIEFRIRSKYA